MISFCVFSSGKCPHSFPLPFNWAVFLLVSCKISLYMSDTRPLPDIWCANMLAHLVGYLFTFESALRLNPHFLLCSLKHSHWTLSCGSYEVGGSASCFCAWRSCLGFSVCLFAIIYWESANHNHSGLSLDSHVYPIDLHLHVHFSTSLKNNN